MKTRFFKTLPEGFRNGTEDDINLAALTIAQAFADYQYPIPSVPVSYTAGLRFHYTIAKAIIENALKYGILIVNDDYSSVMVLTSADHIAATPLADALQELKNNGNPEAVDNASRIFNAVGEMENDIKLKSNTIYLEAIAVQTKHQGKKLCSQMMNKLIDECRANGEDILLFTNTERNVDIYKHFGFEILKEGRLEEEKSYTCFMVKRS